MNIINEKSKADLLKSLINDILDWSKIFIKS